MFVRRYVYQVVVPKQLADKDLLKVFQSKEMTVLPPWDPMVCYTHFLLELFFFNISFGACRVLLPEMTECIEKCVCEGRASCLCIYPLLFKYGSFNPMEAIAYGYDRI